MGDGQVSGTHSKRVTASSSAILQYGGQAVIEGVMMRSPKYFAVACRRPNGEVVTQREDVDKSIIGKLKWLNWPFARGTLALIDAMVLGIKALAFAGNVQVEAEATSSQTAAAQANGQQAVSGAGEKKHRGEIPAMPASGRINDVIIGSTVVASLLFGLGLFVLLPTAITGLITRFHLVNIARGHAAMQLNVADGLIRMVIFLIYILLISRMENIRRVFQYHGAEHKAINTLEAGLTLNLENATKASRIHPRCGTSFIFVVLITNVIVFAFLPRPSFLPFRFLEHLAVIPLVAGIAYEVTKIAGKYRHIPLVMGLLAPGMATQLLTTREPDNSQVEVALAALLSVLEAEGHIADDTDVSQDAPDVLEPAVAIA